MSEFHPIKDAQFIELHTRRSSGHPQRISAEHMEAFLRGELAARSTLQTSPIIDLRPFVQALIKAGYHAVTDAGKGMKATTYRKLWPSTVQIPEEYVGRFDTVLLVDRTIELPALLEKGNIHHSDHPTVCTDIAPALICEDGTLITRYIAFVQLGEWNLRRTVAECCERFASDEVGLVTHEGLHLPVQHEKHLRRLAVDLPGSRSGEFCAPYVSWFDHARPYFLTYDIQSGSGNCGSASRGSRVIPVT